MGRKLSVVLILALGAAGAGCALASSDQDAAPPASTAAVPKPSPKPGPLRVLRANPRYFTDGTGRAVYLTGSHVWWNLLGGTTWRAACLPIRPARFDYARYLDRLVRYNHNFFRLWTFELTRWQECDGRPVSVAPQPWLRTGPGTAHDGLPKFDLARLDSAYFARLRQRVALAQKRKLYVAVMLFEGWSQQFARPPWRATGHPFHAGNNINGIEADRNGDGLVTEVHTLGDRRILAAQERYVRRVVDTVNAFDNVLYEIANESGAFSTAWQYHMIRVVQRHQARKKKRHPVGMTYQNPHGTNATLYSSPAGWVSPAGGRPFLSNPPVADGKRVSLSDTDHHCGICGDRHFPWTQFTRGHNPIFMDPMDGDPEREQIRWAMGHTRHYALRMNLAASRPRPDLASTGFCLAVPGSEYLVYQPRSGAFSVDLRAASRPFRVEWFEPSTGRRWFSRVAGGAHRTLTPPVGTPVVLYLRRA
ncbi:MAG TPA: DUF6298 domain-containing protein [Gaiellaceae bacterium]